MSHEIFTQSADKLDSYKDKILSSPQVKNDEGLYLRTCIRTPRAKNLSVFAEALLHNEPLKAKEALAKFDNYPICITRDLKRAEIFIKDNTLRKERCGKLASSNGKTIGRDSGLFNNINTFHFANWMLDESGVDSSNSLVFSASEFNIQGLEIDWSLLGWDMDMFYANGEWHEQRMMTERLFKESNETQKKHILNSYRVLLTRARKGMIIYVPKKNDFPDKYRVAKYYDSTYEYLKSCGIKDIDEVNTFDRIPNAIKLPF